MAWYLVKDRDIFTLPLEGNSEYLVKSGRVAYKVS